MHANAVIHYTLSDKKLKIHISLTKLSNKNNKGTAYSIIVVEIAI